ncbi:MAG TPA: RHS repeat domain-containing protein [Mucilaginibacter sp.]
MKKWTFGVLGLMLFVTFSCKKGERLQKTYLLSEQIIDDSADGVPIDTTRFFYNRENNLTLVKSSDGTNYTMTYDDAGRVSVAKTINPGGVVVKEFDFYYTPAVSFIEKAISKKPDTAYFTFDSKGEVTEIQTLHGGYSTYTYDERGNIASLKNYHADGSISLYDESIYSYDNMKHYFSAIPHNNYFLMYILYGDASTNINNVVTKNADVYTYTYNNDGYPVKAIAKVVGHSLTPIYYNYIVK